MKKKIKVAYLLDNTNNWIEKHLKKSTLVKKNKKYIEVGAAASLSDFETYITKYYPDYNKILKR